MATAFATVFRVAILGSGQHPMTMKSSMVSHTQKTNIILLKPDITPHGTMLLRARKFVLTHHQDFLRVGLSDSSLPRPQPSKTIISQL